MGGHFNPVTQLLGDGARFLQQGHTGVPPKQFPPGVVDLGDVPAHDSDHSTSLLCVDVRGGSGVGDGSDAGVAAATAGMGLSVMPAAVWLCSRVSGVLDL